MTVSKRTRRSNPVIAMSVIVGLFLVAALPLILSRYSAGRAGDDQNNWHLPTIRTFAREWPHPNVRDYGSATTPGYHLTLAVASRIVGSTDERMLRGLSMIFTIALLATLAGAASSRGAAAAIILCLPAVASLYIFTSGAWLLPDNAGWLGVLLAMMLALRRRVDGWTYLGSTFLITLLVLIRQIDFWVAAPICVAAWLGCAEAQSERSVILRCPEGSGRYARIVLALLTVIPAIVILCFFFHLWHGLVPPTFSSDRPHDIPGAGEHTGGNPSAVALVLASFAALSPFYLPWMSRTPIRSDRGKDPAQHADKRADSRGRAAIWLGLVAGGIAGVLPPTNYDFPAGRWSGLWRIARHTPTIANRSTAIALLSTLGGGLLGYLFTTLGRRDRWIFLTCWLAFIAAQAVNRQAWQRYIDPFVLITLILIASRSGPASSAASSSRGFNWMKAFPVVLAVLLAIITVKSLRH